MVKRTERILFVCLGNICRSPLAEAVLRQAVEDHGLPWTVDSAGTSDWNISNPPDPRAQAVARSIGLDISHLRARQATAEDFRNFDHVIALDSDNLSNLRRLRPADATGRLELLMNYVPGREGQSVADPYFGDDAGFGDCLRDIEAGVQGLIAHLAAEKGISSNLS